MVVNTMLNRDKKVLCIGNTTVETDIKCKQIATDQGLLYCGMVSESLSSPGCYHASFGDFNYSQMVSFCNQADEVVFLDQAITEIDNVIFKNTVGNDYEYLTIDDSSVLVVGCSHTAGTGHVSPSTVYPQLVADQLNLTPIVKGFPGKGNLIIEDELSKYSLVGATVVVQFTDASRLRYFDSDTKSVVNKMGKDYSRAEVEMFTDERMKYEFEQLVKRVVIRLRDAQAKFVFMHLSSTTSVSTETTLFLSQFKEFCWTPDIDVDRANDKLHYGKESHKLLATRIIDRWNNLYAKNN